MTLSPLSYAPERLRRGAAVARELVARSTVDADRYDVVDWYRAGLWRVEQSVATLHGVGGPGFEDGPSTEPPILTCRQAEADLIAAFDPATGGLVADVLDALAVRAVDAINNADQVHPALTAPALRNIAGLEPALDLADRLILSDPDLIRATRRADRLLRARGICPDCGGSGDAWAGPGRPLTDCSACDGSGVPASDAT